MPTNAELVTEITEGPFAAELAASWSDVFTADPERPKLDNRAGILKPDAAYAIWAALTDPARRERGEPHVYRGTFLAAISPLAFALIGKDEETQRAWARLLNLTTGGDEEINVANPSVQGLLDLAVSQGLMSQEQRDQLRGDGKVPCSRADELGWNGFAYTQIIEAKASVNNV
jgi:hypothetical protein